MKYFCRAADKLPHPLLNMVRGKMYEITPRKAFNEYSRGNSLLVNKRFRSGEIVHKKWMTVWGEDISDKELFKRRLEGKVAKEILE